MRPPFDVQLVSLQPVIDLGFSQAQDILGGVGRSFATADVQEIQTAGSLVQILLVACGITLGAEAVSLDQSCSLGVIFLLADNLLHGTNLLSFVSNGTNYNNYFVEIKHFTAGGENFGRFS